MSVGLLDEAVTVRVCGSLVAPELMPVRLTVCRLAFSFMVTLESGFKVGCWFTGLTVTVNVRDMMLLLAPPSSMVTVIVEEPNPLVLGAKPIEPVVFGLV